MAATEIEATTETQVPTGTEAVPIGGSEVPIDNAEEENANGVPTDVAVGRFGRRATILQEFIHNQAASLEDYMVAHSHNTEVSPETEFQADLFLLRLWM